ncbi:hypothetical protein V2J09_013032 [Rumex salicifolius]
MAMQAGLGLSRIIFIFGAGTVLFKHAKLSDLIGELQKLVKGLETSDDLTNSNPDALTAEVLRLAQQVRQLAYNPQVTVLNGSSNQTGITALIIPVGILGTLGYGYMWWKGLSFSDLMYVSKRNMANAVSNLTKHLESVSDALAKTRRHLTQRIENLDGKMDDVKETTKLINKDDQRMDLLEDKQNLTLAGVDWLCQIVDGKRVPTYQQFLQEQSIDSSKSRGQLPSTETLLPLGLKDIADIFTITDGKVQDALNAKTNQPRSIRRIPSVNPAC